VARSGPSQLAATLASTLIGAKLGMTGARSLGDTGFEIGSDRVSQGPKMLVSAPGATDLRPSKVRAVPACDRR
jgi:hypothetical protein